MFVRYWTVSPDNKCKSVCVKKVDTLIAKIIPKDNEGAWGIYLSDRDVPVAVFNSENFAIQTLDRFCAAIESGRRFFDLEACEEEFMLEPDDPESEDKPC